MLYLDSYGWIDADIPKLIDMYLEYELKNKKPTVYEELKNDLNRINDTRTYQLIVPVQKNLSDCGIYLLEYAENFMLNPDNLIADVENDRDRLHVFPKCLFEQKRSQIRNLILELSKGNKQAVQDYLQERTKMIELAQNKEDEFESIDQEQFESYLFETYQTTVNQIDARNRDKAKLAHFLQLQEQIRNKLLNENNINSCNEEVV